jgi:hypothetical protein
MNYGMKRWVLGYLCGALTVAYSLTWWPVLLGMAIIVFFADCLVAREANGQSTTEKTDGDRT